MGNRLEMLKMPFVARDVRSGRSRALSPQARVAVEAQLPSAGP